MKEVYLVFFIIFVLQRISELFLSFRNEKILVAQGYKTYFSRDLPWLKVFHISWFVAQVIEVWLMPYYPPLWLLYVSIFLVCVGQVIRLLSQIALGPRWVIPIMANPKMRRVDHGIYKFHAHPNYLAVIVELFALPLMGGAIITSIIFGLINIYIVTRRMAQEELALSGGAI